MNKNQGQIDQEQNQSAFSYGNFQKKFTFPRPLTSQNAKYTKTLPLSSLNFLEYFTLPQENEFQYVYKPGDDSFFMLNVLRQETDDWISKWGQKKQKNQDKVFSNCVIAEVGSGSGILSAHVSNWLKQKKQSPCLHVSIDINMDASQFSQKYYAKYNLQVIQINTSLFKNTVFSSEQTLKNLKPQIIIFNPPYIPVNQQQIQNERKYLVEKIRKTVQMKKCERKKQQNIIAFSYMGGVDGLQVTRKLLKSIFWNCWVYLIVMEERWYLQICAEIQNYQEFWTNKLPHYNIKGKVELMQFMKFQNEDLFLIRVEVSCD